MSHDGLSSLRARSCGMIENQQLLEQREKQFNLLKIAKTIEGSDKSTRDTKFKINALIREIDKCIVQLNE